MPAARSDAAFFFCCTTITLCVSVFMVHGVQFAGSLAPDKRVFWGGFLVFYLYTTAFVDRFDELLLEAKPSNS